ncbi:hypothetical protein Rs2_35941 [Raphanus sativus]|uniref:Uncharacterized protein LOC108819113 n=1 Tax=Raphanus sativus TaxID=3726 RepID=A0A6J0KI76_RAPSA|nr:uncharacterized protein LOC108819113 [Raphanus sativus]KAJ4878887.1 hypothetical protein Rs2_35941 [Raphanus sativus]
MASTSKQNPSSSKPPRHPFTNAASTPTKSGVAEDSRFRNPSTSVSPITMSPEDQILGRSTHLTRPELLRRRSHNLKQLAKCYRDHYWALMEDLKAQHREYYWKYGVSPLKEENHHHHQNKRRKVEIDGDEVAAAAASVVEGSGDNNNDNNNNNGGNYCVACGNGCKSKAMPLTNYCQLHILSDKRQKLYTCCTFVNKKAQSKAITCPKPTLASTLPALCNTHFQKAQKDVARALKDAGHNVSSANRPPPKLHDIVAAFVHHIQAKRKCGVGREGKLKTSVKEESTS